MRTQPCENNADIEEELQNIPEDHMHADVHAAMHVVPARERYTCTRVLRAEVKFSMLPFFELNRCPVMPESETAQHLQHV